MRDEVRSSFGVNVFGYVTSNQSQGVIARNLIATLRQRGIPVAVTDVVPESGGTGHDETECVTGCDEASTQPHPVTIFCFNPLDSEEFLRSNPRLVRRDRLTAVVVFVEHQKLRSEFRPFLAAVDLVLSPTKFVSDAVQAGVPGSITVPFRQSILVPPGVTSDRMRWNMSETDIVFAFGFDTLSDSTRKNPVGLVAAFQAAFPDRSDVALVLKIGHLAADKSLGGEALRAVALAKNDPRVRIIEEELTYLEVLSLYASADVVSSLHRSEGLGLLMMEAMSVGTPVMATAYSGNLDYMTPENSVLVECELVSVETKYPGYSEMVGAAVWAEPKISSAVAAMRRLADNQKLRRTLTTRALRDMEIRRERVGSGDLLRELDRALARPDVWRSHTSRRLRLWWCAYRPKPKYGVGDLRHVVAVRVKRVVNRRP
ncbi:glycosyltransferase [Nocardioides KLBMP 9356]|uniref:Glycosyltransferase n=1 Tax=Nocardioides potassii TaxID=2911371 RepID=A0ABS9H4V8_9ACTN|nr:glycosyltransferase [Nocardioides potassii]MCF6376290.1 glycosyltransferase [Nocardioides potassii]